MTASEYKKLLIDTVKNSDYDRKAELIELLSLVDISFEKTNSFYGGAVWNQRKENAYISITPDRLPKIKEHYKFLKQTCKDIYPVNEEYALYDIIFKPGVLQDYEAVSQEVMFEDIQNNIVEQIRSAKYVIWIAMAWFTNPVLYQELLKKKKAGLTIEIILDDNSTNHKAPFNLDEEFNVHWVSIESAYKNIMHNKFCIIDFATVIHGTFNWTNAANYNKETCNIDKNRAIAEKFADEFMKIKRLEYIES